VEHANSLHVSQKNTAIFVRLERTQTSILLCKFQPAYFKVYFPIIETGQERGNFEFLDKYLHKTFQSELSLTYLHRSHATKIDVLLKEASAYFLLPFYAWHKLLCGYFLPGRSECSNRSTSSLGDLKSAKITHDGA
jgi:hypothetical protein